MPREPEVSKKGGGSKGTRDKKRESKRDKPIDFNSDAERGRWLKIYDRELDRGADPAAASTTALKDMEIRRRVFPLPTAAPGLADVMTIAQEALERERGLLHAVGVETTRERCQEIEALIARLAMRRPG